MKQEDCTELLLRYRDMARMIWNLAFWPNPDVRDGDCFTAGDYHSAYVEAMARLYEGMVLLPLGHNERVQDWDFPGDGVALSIQLKHPKVECLIDQSLPNAPGHTYKPLGVPIQPGEYEFEFRRFFDWDSLGHRDFQFVTVLVKRLPAMPGAVGHLALIPFSECLVLAELAGDSE